MARFSVSFITSVAFLAAASFGFAQGTGAPAPAAPAPVAPAPQPPPASEAPVLEPLPPQEEAVFGKEVELPARPALMLDGNSSWDEFYVASRKALEQLEKTAKLQGLMPAGAPMVRVQMANDETVIFTAFLPIVQMSQSHTVPIAPVTLGEAPSGQHLKFTHQGAYDTIDQTYGEITDFLEGKALVAEDYFVEEYPLDPETTPETEMQTHIYVRLKK